ncbi:MAG: hypothetical protein A2381_14325 [Bdellovibrionales bacterium RIFOXYB1_FULL_37_110]|nr:MAG: hypothetical protein A2417_07095 [Bdellovibrionales bacterium RIFOXYC1_FULL_37_79]OFZ57518.1 MAG: hypothetical protein A2381_14325 [Bdellovibrionales bacterium RIFOXYB1_FULL_37_110]OFZ62989.1 MAG: hypothetical protein A2577_07605 [Bdellovibrionales bacterium RIFOXYD1_FULL_36_51]
MKQTLELKKEKMHSHNLFSLFLLSLIAVTMLSCGNSLHKKRTLAYRNPFFAEEGYDACVNQRSSEVSVVDEVFDFEIKFKTFYDRFLLVKYPQISSLVSNKYRIGQPVFTITQPLILNSDELNRQFQNIIDQFHSSWELHFLYGEILSYGESVPDLSDEMRNVVADQVVYLETLKNHAIRFKKAICKKKQLVSNQKYDVSPFLDKVKWANAYYENEDLFFKLVSEQLPLNFRQHFFSISRDLSPVTLSCKKNQAKFQLLVRIYEENLDHQSMIKDAIESYWQSDDIKVLVNFVSSKNENILQIYWLDSYSSYVEFDNTAVIFLGKKNHPSLQPKILAHEFGHVLGFNDCYVEFFNQADQFVYYELNGYNLMCSLNGKFPLKIPSIYMRQVASKYCMDQK